MPLRQQVDVNPVRSRRNLWFALLMVVLLMMAGLAYLRSRPDVDPSDSADSTYGGAEFSARHLYSETADPKVEIANALTQAGQEHKRVILDFGGDWCVDCQVLDLYLHESSNVRLLDANFILVHVSIGHMDTNLELARSYGVPIERGVPALAVLAPDGKLLYAQGTGEFNKMRQMQMSSVTEFLNQWKS